ncbi:MAG: hypothetical protein QOH21_2438, partial [Acidobacteriota bacterium]|nr:hypothetical protein [Acidobacteriota bacterium]
MFVNTVALRADLGGDPTFLELLARVRETSLDAFSHDEVPFDRVIDALGLERDASRTPLFQTMLVLTASQGAALTLDGLQQEWIVPADTVARFDLTLSVAVNATAIDCVFDYATALFDAETIERFGHAFEHLLRGALAHPEQRISRLPLFDDAERAELLHRSHGASVARPDGATLHGLFIEQAKKTPDADAIVAPGRTVTYAELDRWTDDLAAQLAAICGSDTTTVALLADRSPDAIAAVLAILKAGYAYLPIDPKTPADRLEWLLADAKAVLLDEKQFLGVPRSSSGTVHSPRNSEEPEEPRGTAPAYIIYTSGSTGTPKGVVVEHRSAVNLALSFAESHGFAGHRVLMIPPLPFDASVGDVFPAFATGAALVLHPSPGELNAAELARYCAAHGVTAIDAPAALWRRWTEEWSAGAVPRSSSGSSEFLGDATIAEELRGTPRNSEEPPIPSVTLMMVGGESVPAAEVRRFAQLTQGRVRFFNHYGPTEATVCATTHDTIDASEVAAGELPIGKPLPNVTAYVLDRWLEPVPDGVAGELYLGGIGVARGYHGRAAQTAERFLPDPFSTTPGARLYRTGDLARRLADGSLLFLGRSDRQIKLRGFRIEPGEIEAALLAHDDIRGAIVVLREQRLAAYVVSDKTSIGDTLAAFLRERLPEYMIPTAFVVLDELPLTSNGKVDLRALPEPPKPVIAGRVTAPPRNPLETALVSIWSEVLKRDDVGIEDDFFALGGDSLRTMPVIFKVQQQFGIELPLSAVFTAPTVARFAPLVENAMHGRAETALSLEERIGPPITITDAARAAQRPAGEAPHAALLTGATGFLGAFLLDELLRATPATVYCLVRAKDPDDGLRRIRENLATYGLTADLTRIVPLLGDLALPHLGLDEAMLQYLAEALDVIYHNG